MKRLLLGVALSIATVAFLGCNNSNSNNAGNSSSTSTGSSGGAANESFSLAWSEYPSWSVFGVAGKVGLIDPAKGKMGTLEEKWKVDIELQALDYDGCLTAYSSGTTDAVCITNMDILSPSLGRTSVAIMPTSTSDGADACIVTGGITSVDDLEGKESRGLEASVSQYLFERGLEIRGKDPKAFPFKQMDPQAAAQAMQTKQDNVQSIVVWNPFVIQTKAALGNDAIVLFDSTEIPEEIVDMVVVGEDSLKKPGGDAFAMCVIDAFYEVNRMLADTAKGDETLLMLGKEGFSEMSLADMKTIVEQTKFYKTPDEGIGIFSREDFQKTLMPRVVDFCASHGLIETKPTIDYASGGSGQLRFDTSFMTKYKSQ